MNFDDLEEQLRKLQKEFLALTTGQLEISRDILNNATTNLVELYSNQIRNLGTIAGVVAPFSLALLTVDRIDINTPLLISGFALLIGDIILSQLLLNQQLFAKDSKITNAELDLISASFHKSMVENENIATIAKAEHISEYVKDMSNVRKQLDLELFDHDRFKTKHVFRGHLRILNIVFVAGCLFIILSTLINPAIDGLVHFPI